MSTSVINFVPSTFPFFIPSSLPERIQKSGKEDLDSGREEGHDNTVEGPVLPPVKASCFSWIK